MNSERYVVLDFEKILYTVLISIFHFLLFYNQPARGGFIAVEFFFIISGFLLANSFEKSYRCNEFGPKKLIYRRLWQYYPHYLFSFFVLYIFKNSIVKKYSVQQWLCSLKHIIPELLLVHGTIISDETTGIYNSCTWYLSALLISEYFFWCIFLSIRNTKVFDLYIRSIPLFVFFLYSYMYYHFGTTNNWRTHVCGIFNMGILRAFAGISLGILLFYRCEQRIYTEDKCKKNRIAGYIIMSLPFIMSFLSYRRASFVYIILFALGMYSIRRTDRTELNSIWLKRLELLSKIAYGMFLNHYFVSYFILMLNKSFSIQLVIIYLLVLFFYSIGTVYLVDYLVSRVKALFEKSKKCER